MKRLAIHTTVVAGLILAGLMLLSFQQNAIRVADPQRAKRAPNILFAIADDQSFPHASAYGQPTFHTPVFDSVAARGILFTNAFVAAPQCSPSRAAILTGRQIWQIEEAGTHSSYFPKKYPVFTDALEKAGYALGFTGKPWDPGNWEDAGWSRNPVGPEYNKRKLSNPPTKGISKTDYVANFKDFLAEKPADKPFFFWYGSQEPHRVYDEGSGLAAGLSAKNLSVPPFLPNTDIVKSDLLDYALEIQWFDSQLGKMLAMLDAAGELENTIVVVTADNGMAFPYAKANLQEYGIHVPLAICGPIVNGRHRTVSDLVGLIDLAPTFLELAQVPLMAGMAGKSLAPIFRSTKSGGVDASRAYVLTGRERHTHARPDNLGYPARAIRTAGYLYIKNFTPDRWPLGDPAPKNPTVITAHTGMKPILEGYEDIDDSPTKTYLVKNQTAWPEQYRLGFEKRGSDELYAIKTDPYCLHNLAGSEKLAPVREKLARELLKKLTEQHDPRVMGTGDIFDTYPRFGLMRPFEGFKEQGKYNPNANKK